MMLSFAIYLMFTGVWVILSSMLHFELLHQCAGFCLRVKKHIVANYIHLINLTVLTLIFKHVGCVLFP